MSTATELQEYLAFDEYGLLVNPDDWNEGVAIIIANRNGIE